ncbi:MAG: hypothetical protein WD029_01155 [Microthrixaceae bacterium]
MASRHTHQGTVLSFDDLAGLGTVVDVHGNKIDFHCTAILDGTRSIVPGTEVTFLLRQGTLGRLEAVQISPQYSN